MRHHRQFKAERFNISPTQRDEVPALRHLALVILSAAAVAMAAMAAAILGQSIESPQASRTVSMAALALLGAAVLGPLPWLCLGDHRTTRWRRTPEMAALVTDFREWMKTVHGYDLADTEGAVRQIVTSRGFESWQTVAATTATDPTGEPLTVRIWADSAGALQVAARETIPDR